MREQGGGGEAGHLGTLPPKKLKLFMLNSLLVYIRSDRCHLSATLCSKEQGRGFQSGVCVVNYRYSPRLHPLLQRPVNATGSLLHRLCAHCVRRLVTTRKKNRECTLHRIGMADRTFNDSLRGSSTASFKYRSLARNIRQREKLVPRCLCMAHLNDCVTSCFRRIQRGQCTLSFERLHRFNRVWPRALNVIPSLMNP